MKKPLTIYVFHNKMRYVHLWIPGVKREDIKIEKDNLFQSLKLKAGNYEGHVYFPGTKIPNKIKSEYKTAF